MESRPNLRPALVLAAIAVVLAGGWWLGLRHMRTEAEAPFRFERSPSVIRTVSDVVTIGLRGCLESSGTPTITAIRPQRTGDVETVGVATRVASIDQPPLVVVAESFPPSAPSFAGIEWRRFDGMFEVTRPCGGEFHELIFGLRFGPGGGTFGDITVEYDYRGASFEAVLEGSWVRCGPATEGVEACGV